MNYRCQQHRISPNEEECRICVWEKCVQEKSEPSVEDLWTLEYLFLDIIQDNQNYYQWIKLKRLERQIRDLK